MDSVAAHGPGLGALVGYIHALGLTEASNLSLAKGLAAEKGNSISQNSLEPQLLLTHPTPETLPFWISVSPKRPFYTPPHRLPTADPSSPSLSISLGLVGC